MQEIEEEEEASCSKQQQLHADFEEADDASCSKAHRLHEDSEEEELARGLEFDKYSDRYGGHALPSKASSTADLCPCLCGPCLALSSLCQTDTRLA